MILKLFGNVSKGLHVVFGFYRCDCGNCEPMTTSEECTCCSNVSAVSFHMQPEDLQCITEHEVFVANCLNRHVLQVSMYAYLENVGPFDDNEPINE